MLEYWGGNTTYQKISTFDIFVLRFVMLISKMTPIHTVLGTKKFAERV